MVLSFEAALGGGVVRDLLLGATPPQSLRDWRYATTAFMGGASVFFFHRFVLEFPASDLIISDAAGLSLFAVAGTEKAMNYRVGPFIAALLGNYHRRWWRSNPRRVSCPNSIDLTFGHLRNRRLGWFCHHACIL
jgi:Glycine transporter